jgi:hypothetical protein
MTTRGSFAIFFRSSLLAGAVASACLLPGLTGCGGDSSTGSSPTPAASVTKTIGPEGGTIVVDGATMTFPPGAVTTPTSITIAATTEAAPDGFVALSPVFRCEPSGTSFPVKVTMAMTFSGDPARATIFWSSAATPEFTDVGGSVSGSVMTTEVAHFSRGFVGRKL